MFVKKFFGGNVSADFFTKEFFRTYGTVIMYRTDAGLFFYTCSVLWQSVQDVWMFRLSE